jgi:ABC-type transport system involved in multi-copper enzyme maturation permease subunit
MRKLIALELKRNRLRPYHIATLICGLTMLGFQYLMAAIPYMDPTEPDAELFSQYPFLMGITCLVCMAIFSILSAVMASRFVVEEYSRKRAILLLSYPISRKKVLCAKLVLVFAYTVSAMLLCGAVIQAVFFLTESLFPLCSDQLTINMFLQSLGFLLSCSILAGLLGVVSLWFGFRKKSVSMTIVASVVLAALVCQVIAAALAFLPMMGAALGVTGILAALAIKNLLRQINNMEV